MAAGSLALAVSSHSSAPTERKGSRPRTGQLGVGLATRDLAAAWVADQVSRTAVVSCDSVMCRALVAHGVPAAALLRLTPGMTDPLRSDVIVATAAVRRQFGSRLNSVYAPAVIARFGTGKLRIAIRAIAKHGASAYRAALRADLRARKTSGTQMLLSNRIAASASARAELSAGKVDSRLLITIADLAARNPIYIVAFGDSGPGASAGMPLRSVDVADAAPSNGRSALMRAFLALLRGQSTSFSPAHSQSVLLESGQTVLRIEFAAPSPFGLLGPYVR
jgi:hypothetical protein